MNSRFLAVLPLLFAATTVYADPGADLAAEMEIYKTVCPSNTQSFKSGVKAGIVMGGKTALSPLLAVGVGIEEIMLRPITWVHDALSTEEKKWGEKNFGKEFLDDLRELGLTSDTYLDPIREHGAVSEACAESIQRITKLREQMKGKVASRTKNSAMDRDIAQDDHVRKTLPNENAESVSGSGPSIRSNVSKNAT